MRTFDFFNDISDFKEVVPGIDQNTVLRSMQASHERSKQKLIKILTQPIYDGLKTAFTADENPTEKQTAAIEYLQGAHGNNIAYFEMISKVISKKTENVNYYKYEIFMEQENYLDGFSVHMDLLLDYLDANKADFEGWAETDTYKNRQNLILKTANEFNAVFPTGGSSYFFNLVTPFQNQVIEMDIISRVKITAIPENLTKIVKYFVAYRTMAKAARLVDYADLPKSLRNKLYVEDSKKKLSEAETSAERYANQFEIEANRYLAKIDFELQKPADDVIEVSAPYTDINEETDQTFVIS